MDGGNGPEAGGIACSNSLFDQPWWLDAVAPGSWDAVVVRSGGQVVARLPYTTTRRYGLTLLGQPPLTQFLGPWLAPVAGKQAHRLEVEKDRMSALIAALPRFDRFQQSFSPRVSNWLPFYWAGFSATVRYTYRLDDLDDLDAVWAGFQENVRRQIRKAERQVEVRDDLGLATFVRLNEATFERRGQEVPYSAGLVRCLDEACAQRGVRKILFAVDSARRVHAAIYVVWDANSAYYLMGGRSDEFRTSGATSLLMWKAIQSAAGVTRAFDFEGSMIESIERFFRSFGATQTPFFHVGKSMGVMRALWPLRAARGGGAGG
jgi:hypothetical protein